MTQELLKEIEELRGIHFQKLKKYNQERLVKEAEEETENYEKVIKDKMFGCLSNWALGPEGFFYSDGGLKDGIEICLTKNYRNEIVNAFIEEIKQNPQDWKIEEEDRAIHHKVSCGGCFVVKHKSGRKHYRPFPLGYKNGHNLFSSFSPEEWAEIENVLNTHSNPENPSKKKQVNYDTEPVNNLLPKSTA